MAKRTPSRQAKPRPSEEQRLQPGLGEPSTHATMNRRANVRDAGVEYRAGDLDPDRDEIARRAYQLYCERGCEPGREMDDWLRAEYELRNHQR